MLKENLKDEKIQTNASEEIKSEDLQKRGEQNAKEESYESAWRSRSLKFLALAFDNKETALIVFQYSRFIDAKWSPFVPYSSYVHFTAPEPDLKSIILGSLDNLDIGVYRFKLLSIFKYHYYWSQVICDPEIELEDYPVLEIRVFSENGVKGFEVIDCYDIEEKIVKNEI